MLNQLYSADLGLLIFQYTVFCFHGPGKAAPNYSIVSVLKRILTHRYALGRWIKSLVLLLRIQNRDGTIAMSMYLLKNKENVV